MGGNNSDGAAVGPGMRHRSNEMTPYAAVRITGGHGTVLRKYKTREACTRWAPHHGLTPVVVDPGTRVGERIQLVPSETAGPL